MDWYDIQEPNDPELDQLALRYGLHPLHVEDCRHRNQRAKVENGPNYLFVVLKPLSLNSEGSLDIDDLDVFLGDDYIITVQECKSPPVRQIIEQVKLSPYAASPGQALYRVMDLIVDTYAPVLDRFDDLIDELEDEVLEAPSPESLARIFSLKRCLVDMRRAVVNMRDVANHLQRADTELLSKELGPFMRDVYDHLARYLDLLEGQRDLLTGALDIYLSSVANRTNQVMKVLTGVGTLALPVLVVSGIYGMNVEGLPWAETPTAFARVLLIMFTLIAVLVGVLKLRRWL
jgi:magnesium transporter